MWPTAAFPHAQLNRAVQQEERDNQGNATTFTMLSKDFISYSFFGRQGKRRMGKCLKTS